MTEEYAAARYEDACQLLPARLRSAALALSRREKAGADKMELETFTLGGLRRAVQEGDTENGSLMAGQVAGMCGAIRPVAEILAELAG